MKLRGLSSLTAVFILVVVSPLLINLYKSRNSLPSNESKNNLTAENTKVSVPKKLKNIIAGNLQKQSEMTERVDFANTPLVERERFYTENEINNMTEAEFVELLKTTELSLPKLSDLKELPPGALHTTPAPVLQAGKDLGLLKEILEVHAPYEKHAVGFYEKCAKNSERPTPVRALCLTNLVGLKKKSGEKINIKEYPAQLVELTRMVSEL